MSQSDARPSFPVVHLRRVASGGEIRMQRTTLSRRNVLEAASFALAAAAVIPQTAGAHVQTGLSAKNEATIRRWYAAWEKKDWRPVDNLLADDFTFTSAAGDDRISKTAFKTQCWDTQIAFIDRFELKRVLGKGDEAFVMYVCRTKSGKSFRNVEYIRLQDDKLQALECYFGAQSGYPSAVSSGKG
jgi:ketosteroid isomerase-like protein